MTHGMEAYQGSFLHMQGGRGVCIVISTSRSCGNLRSILQAETQLNCLIVDLSITITLSYPSKLSITSSPTHLRVSKVYEKGTAGQLVRITGSVTTDCAMSDRETACCH
jgi:hypothetical protein